MSNSNCDACVGFRRSELLRHGAATAGRGLPSIEAGMPTPAGTGLNRRSFILRSLGTALTVYGGVALSQGGIDAAVAAGSTPTDPVLVSIFMPGGMDSLSLLAPVEDPIYRSLRPTLALSPDAGTPLAEDTRLRWHPAVEGLATLYGEGKVSVVPAVGYDHPNNSHFTSRHYWEVGNTEITEKWGWMGRYLDLVGSDDNPLQGLSLSDTLSPALAATRVPVATVADPFQYNFYAQGVQSTVQTGMRSAFAGVGTASSPDDDDAVAYARSATADTAALREQLLALQSASETSTVTYPDTYLGKRLKAVAAMLGLGMPMRCVAVDADGFYDTHSAQEPRLSKGLKTTADAIFAFQRDLEARGLQDRVLMHVWSEFGRRPKENLNGTDHGSGGASLVIGSRAKGQMVGEWPGLATLDSLDNLRSTVDFRTIYCSLLEQWMGVDASLVIPGAAGIARAALVN
jgi:uncharacterized protein (DUF1501 family)